MQENEMGVIPSLPLAKRGPGRPRKHGLYSKYTLIPLTEVKLSELREVMKGQQRFTGPGDEILINTLARALAFLEIITYNINKDGYYQDDADGKSRGGISPLVSQFWAGIGKISKLCEQLGLTPQSRIKLGKGVPQREDVASKIQEAKEA